MSDEIKKELETAQQGCEVISDDELTQVTGGGMRDKIVITETTPISESTKDKI